MFSQDAQDVVQYDDARIEPQTITEDHLKTYKEDDAYDYIEVKQETTLWDKFKKWLRNFLIKFWESIFGVGTASGFLYFMLKIFPWVLLAVLLFLLIRLFLKVKSNKLITEDKAKNKVAFTEEEQIIKNEDINALINQAIAQGNYRLAVRYCYLQSLKYLTEKEMIDWQPQKTNTDYLAELSKSQLQKGFANITKIYDYVWYGEFNIDAAKFESLKLNFETLNQNITKA